MKLQENDEALQAHSEMTPDVFMLVAGEGSARQIRGKTRRNRLFIYITVLREKIVKSGGMK